MLFSQNIRTAFRGLTANKLRSGLTILGIVIGVAAVVALMGIGTGATSSITDSISSNGSNLLTVMSGRPQRPSSGGFVMPKPITYKDFLALEKTLTDIAGIAPSYQSSYTVAIGAESASISVVGVTEDYFSVNNYTIASGRGITVTDRNKEKQVAVIGQTIVDDYFSNVDPLGQTLKISNKSFTVVGVLESKDSSGFTDENQIILIPLETGYNKLFGSNAIRNGERTVSSIAISAASAEAVDSVSTQITFVLRHQHGLTTDESDDFRVQNQAELLSTLTSVTTTLTTFLGAIAAISLLVGGIGIMNITLVSVSERTREIGLRKAVGARKDHILFQFLIETMTLAILGGLIGIGVGMAIAWGVTALGLITSKVSMSSIMLSFFFSAAIGLFFGLYPAYRAANLEPMEALRSE